MEKKDLLLDLDRGKLFMLSFLKPKNRQSIWKIILNLGKEETGLKRTSM